MSEFENATPRPWAKDKRGHLYGSNGNRVTTFELGAADASFPPSQEERDNSELFLRAVNAFEPLISALEMVRDADEDCKRDSLPTMPPIPRAKIEAALAKARGEQ